jgi:hypothetical protein
MKTKYRFTKYPMGKSRQRVILLAKTSEIPIEDIRSVMDIDKK